MNNPQNYFKNLWIKYDTESFQKKIEILLEISQINPNDYGKDKDNVLKEIKTNLNIIKFEKYFIRKAKFIEEESLKLKDNEIKKLMLKNALDIYIISKKFLEYLKNKSNLEHRDFYLDSNYNFINSKIELLGTTIQLKEYKPPTHQYKNIQNIKKRSLAEILKEINEILGPFYRDNSVESVKLSRGQSIEQDNYQNLRNKLNTLIINSAKLNEYNELLTRIHGKMITNEKILNQNQKIEK